MDVAYGSNVAPVENTPPAGVVAPFSPLSPVLEGASQQYDPAYSVVIPPPGTQPDYYTPALASNFIGLAPGLLGVYQINFQVPQNAPAGDATIYLRQNRDGGFFFSQDCGRGLTSSSSTGARLPVAAP